MHSIIVTVITISVITKESVPEQVGTVQACATLSGASYTDTQINVTLDTISGMYPTYIYIIVAAITSSLKLLQLLALITFHYLLLWSTLRVLLMVP